MQKIVIKNWPSQEYFSLVALLESGKVNSPSTMQIQIKISIPISSISTIQAT